MLVIQKNKKIKSNQEQIMFYYIIPISQKYKL